MNSLLEPLEIKYLAVENKSQISLIVKNKFARLKKTCNYIQNCQVRIANIAPYKETEINCSYLVRINVIISEECHIETLRAPQSSKEDSIKIAIAEAFAKIYRQLIDLQIKKQIIYG